MRRSNLVFQNRFRVLDLLGDDAVIWIDPAKVRHFAPRQTVTKICRIANLIGRDIEALDRLAPYLPDRLFFGSYVLKDEDFHAVRPIEKMKHYILVDDLIKSLPDFKRSKWYQSHLANLASKDATKHKEQRLAREEDVSAFFEKSIIPMMAEIKQSGYDAKKYRIEGRCFIGPNGEIYKGLAARHRFAMALLLGVRSFPLKVHGVHEKWFAANVGDRMDAEKLKAAIRSAGASNA
jgi:hypothetical protein